MTTHVGRKKQPDLVKAQLLQAAAQEAVQKGLTAITLDAVAKRAGVSKGGLLHHFPSRQALVEALFEDTITHFEGQINQLIAQDPNPAGRFSRAYLNATCLQQDGGLDSELLAMATLAMSTDEGLARRWQDWLGDCLDRSGEGRRSAVGHLVRYAADGLWLEDCAAGVEADFEIRREVIAKLIELSYTI